MNTITAKAFPLHWPMGFPRAAKQETGQFRTTLKGAIDNVNSSLKAFAKDSGKPLSNLVISSNVTLGVDKPKDPGVAIWFTWDGLQVCIPVDRYSSTASNLQAIHHILEARRTELRHGTLHLVRASFQGFKALPEKSTTNDRPWWEVLGVKANDTSTWIDSVYKTLVKKRHPDAGGNHDEFIELQNAYEQSKKR